MGYLVVSDQLDLDAVAATVLRSRVAKATRASALVAIADANPGVDLTRLRPGLVLVIPPVAGVRVPKGGADDLAGGLDELLGRTQEALAPLPEQAVAQHEQAERDLRETKELLGSDAVGRLLDQVPGLREKAAGVLATAEQDARDAAEHTAVAKEATAGWLEELAELRGLGPR